MSTKKSTTYRLVESALMIALAALLSFLKINGLWAQGGSITAFSMLPIVYIGYKYGPAWGCLTGLAHGILQLIFAGGIAGVSVGTFIAALFLDYLLAFSVLGLSGVFKNKLKNKIAAFAAGAAFVSFLRFVCHFLSGILLWRAYAPEGMVPELYSLLYNGGFMLPEIIITTIGAAVVSRYLKIADINGVEKTA